MAENPKEETPEVSQLSAEDSAHLEKLIKASGGFYVAKEGKAQQVPKTPEYRDLFKAASPVVRAVVSDLVKTAKDRVSKELKSDKENPERNRRVGSSKTETVKAAAAGRVKKLGTAKERADVVSARAARVAAFPKTSDIADVKETLSLKQRGQTKITDPDTGKTVVVPDPSGTVQLEGTGATPRIQGGTSQVGPRTVVTGTGSKVVRTKEAENLHLYVPGEGHKPVEGRTNIRVVRPGEEGHSGGSDSPELHPEDLATYAKTFKSKEVRPLLTAPPGSRNADSMGRVGPGGRKPTAKDYVSHILYMQGWGADAADDDLAPNTMYEAPRADDEQAAQDVSEQLDIPTTPFTESSSLVEPGEAGAITFGKGGKDIVKGSARSAADTESRALSELGAIPTPGQGDVPNPLAEASDLERSMLQTNQSSKALSSQFDTTDSARLSAAANLLITPELNRMRLREGEAARGVAEPVYRGNYTVRRRPSESKLVKTPVMDPNTGRQARDSRGKLVWKKDRSGQAETQPLETSGTGKEEVVPSRASVTGPFSVEPDETSPTLTPYEKQIAESYLEGISTAGSKQEQEAEAMRATRSEPYTATVTSRTETYDPDTGEATVKVDPSGNQSGFGGPFTPTTNLDPAKYPWVDKSAQPYVRTIPGAPITKDVEDMSDEEQQAYFDKLQEAVEAQDEARGSRQYTRKQNGELTDIGLDTDVVASELAQGGELKEVKGSEQVVTDPTTGKRTRSGQRRVILRRNAKRLKSADVSLEEMANNATVNAMRVPSYYVAPQPAGVYRSDTRIDPATGNVRIPAGVSEKLKFKGGEEVLTNVDTADPRWTDYDYSTKMVEKESTDEAGNVTKVETPEEGVVRRIVPTAKGLKPVGPTIEEDTADKIEQFIPGFKEKGIPGVISSQLVLPMFANIQKDILKRKAAGETGPVRLRSEAEQREYLKSIGEKPMYTDEEAAKLEDYRAEQGSRDEEDLRAGVEALAQRKPYVEQGLADLAAIKDIKSKAEADVMRQIREGSHPMALRKDGTVNPTFMPIEPLAPGASPEEKKRHRQRTSAQKRVVNLAGRKAVSEHIAKIEEGLGFKTTAKGYVRLDESGTPIQRDDDGSVVNPDDETEIRVRMLRALQQRIDPTVAGTSPTRSVAGTDAAGNPKPRKFYYEIEKDKHGKAVLDSEGNPVIKETEERNFPEYVTDESGKPTVDARGNPVPVLDKAGNPVTKRANVKLTPFVTTAEQLGKGKNKTPGVSVKSELDIQDEGGVWHPTENPTGKYIVKEATPVTVARTKSERLREKGLVTRSGEMKLGDEGLIHSVLDSLRVPTGDDAGTTKPFLTPVPQGVSISTLNDLNYRTSRSEMAGDMASVEEATGETTPAPRSRALGSQFDIPTTGVEPRDPSKIDIPESTAERIKLAQKLKINLSISTPNMLRTATGSTRQSAGKSVKEILGPTPKAPAEEPATNVDIDESAPALGALAQATSGVASSDALSEFSLRKTREENAAARQAMHAYNKADAARKADRFGATNPYAVAFLKNLPSTTPHLNEDGTPFVPKNLRGTLSKQLNLNEQQPVSPEEAGAYDPDTIQVREDPRGGRVMSWIKPNAPTPPSTPRTAIPTLMPTTATPVGRPYLEGDEIPTSRLVTAGQYTRIGPKRTASVNDRNKRFYGEVTYTGEGPRYSEIAGPGGRGKRGITISAMSPDVEYPTSPSGLSVPSIPPSSRESAFPGQARPALGPVTQAGTGDLTPDNIPLTPTSGRQMPPPPPKLSGQFDNTTIKKDDQQS